MKGSKLELKCEASGMSPFSYKWSRNNKPLPDVDGRILEVSKATEEDEGIYMCIVTNEFNKDGYPSNQLVINVGTLPASYKVQPVANFGLWVMQFMMVDSLKVLVSNVIMSMMWTFIVPQANFKTMMGVCLLL